jgi:dihydroorotate dehydrogenase electron transfer subunit
VNAPFDRLIQSDAAVVDRTEIVPGIFVLRLRSPEIAHRSAPGQFVNIRCGEGCLPFLRRPFSISRIDGDLIELMFNVIGHGTRMLASKRPGDGLDVLGPLGVPFGFRGDFETALLVGGGLGVAPFPFLTDSLIKEKKEIVTFVGSRTGEQISERHLRNVRIATDDGSIGFRGTVVDLLRSFLTEVSSQRFKIFGCGPTKMLKALSDLSSSAKVDCELSLEGDMACGMGICQGCPVERSDGAKKYSLVCTEGPTFNSKAIILR